MFYWAPVVYFVPVIPPTAEGIAPSYLQEGFNPQANIPTKQPPTIDEPWIAMKFGRKHDTRRLCLDKTPFELYNCNQSKPMKIHIEFLMCDSIRCRVLEWDRGRGCFEFLEQPFHERTTDELGFTVIQKEQKKSVITLKSLKTEEVQKYALEIEFTVASEHGPSTVKNLKVFGTVNGGRVEKRTEEYMEDGDFAHVMDRFHDTPRIKNLQLKENLSSGKTQKKNKRSISPPKGKPQKKARFEESKDILPSPKPIMTDPPQTKPPYTDNAEDQFVNLAHEEDIFASEKYINFSEPSPSRPNSPGSAVTLETSGDEDQESGQSMAITEESKEKRPVDHNYSPNNDLLSLFGYYDGDQFSNCGLPFDSTMVDLAEAHF